jgi:hypothetical protein
VGGGFSVPINTTDVLFVTSSYRSAPDAWTIVALQQRGRRGDRLRVLP